MAIAGDRRYWWWENAFYWENEGYQSMDVKALVTRARKQKERSLHPAHDHVVSIFESHMPHHRVVGQFGVKD